jgi:glutamate 5-kinase
MTIASGKVKGVLSRIAAGERIGTLFLPQQKTFDARRRWIAFSKKIKGKIYIDEGAKEAILSKGKSLLGVGVIKTEGTFKSGDAVCIVDKDGVILGCGLVNYACDVLVNAKQKKLEKEVIHRNNFVTGSTFNT